MENKKSYENINMKRKMDILTIAWKREQKVQHNDSNKNNLQYIVLCASRTRDLRRAKRETYH